MRKFEEIAEQLIALDTVIAYEIEEDYYLGLYLRPTTDEEDADFEELVAYLGGVPALADDFEYYYFKGKEILVEVKYQA